MLIIGADDFGIGRSATDNILLCYHSRRITSTSAMMFMVDSERAAKLALDTSLGVGLHLNLSQAFTASVKLQNLQESHSRIIKFLKRAKYNFLLFNPLLKKEFECVYQAQYEEFIRLFKREPTHIDGHHHMHLCTQMLLQNIMPRGMRVRTTFTFTRKEKGLLNRFYRRMISYWVSKRYRSTDFLYSIEPIIRMRNQRSERLKEITNLAKMSSVEIQVHPQRQNECDYLMGDEFLQAITEVKTISYDSL